jgi:hypothetical protein
LRARERNNTEREKSFKMCERKSSLKGEKKREREKCQLEIKGFRVRERNSREIKIFKRKKRFNNNLFQAKIMKRHPEMQLIENLRVETLIEEASHMYAKVKNPWTNK